MDNFEVNSAIATLTSLCATSGGELRQFIDILVTD